jgi:hypothetical protein
MVAQISLLLYKNETNFSQNEKHFINEHLHSKNIIFLVPDTQIITWQLSFFIISSLFPAYHLDLQKDTRDNHPVRQSKILKLI